MYDVEEVTYGTKEFQEYVDVRMEVFVREQGVPEDEELDEHETSSTHLAIRQVQSGRLVAVCRLLPCPPFVKLERVAVLKTHRGEGLGVMLNDASMALARSRWPRLLPTAHAQTSALPFYSRLGFLAVSDEFLDEVNILHRTIILPDVQSIREYDIIEYDASLTHGKPYIKGEYKDPDVIASIKHMLIDIMAMSFIPLSTVTNLLCAEILGAGLMKKFTSYAARVVDEQVRTDSRLSGSMGMLKPSLADEGMLLGMGWDKLNTGHYSEVSIFWRYFYFAVSLCKSIRLRSEGCYDEALRALDMGLLMGAHKFTDEQIISIVEHVQRQIPLEAINVVDYECLDDVPVAHPLSKPVDISCGMDDEDFLEKYVLKNRPVLIRGAVASWPASSKWTMSCLHGVLAPRLVPVELGSKYTDEGWSQRLMTGHEFFQQILSNDKKEEGPLYLAQHRLLEQVPQLKKDIEVPIYCMASGQIEKDVDVNVWIGPRGTVSPLHTDPKDNLFCQVSGTKFVRLVAPADSEKVYAMDEGILTNTSKIDAECPDDPRFPLFSKADCFDIVVEAGDALFIPKGWWHHLRALSPSVSLSFWFEQGI